MISSDDHPPPDPSSDHQNHQDSNDLKINNDIDLLKSLIAYLEDTNNPVPSFSIRDYVFDSRNKDIASNWPFSRKSLQICLQHGVTNLLPPFQNLESLRDYRRSNKETISSSNGNPIDDQFISTKSINTNSSGSKRDNESREVLAHTKSKKTVFVSSHIAIKKCKKLNSRVEPVENVTITPNNFILSETMASKVCPVCKTFSSSSNTTLNAHIDQCLTGESSMKWIANPKVMVKHRIKPRKTRLMVDIYKTAPRCTVEELDARNGTSWANKSSFPAQELEFQGEEEKETTFINREVADHEGAVYIDTNGTKVRILSVPKVSKSDDHGAQKLPKKKKNKDHEHKHQQKYLKLSPNSKKPNHGASEVTTGQEENVAIKESCIKEDRGKQREVHMKMDDLPIIRPPWACSKRTVLAKKLHSRTPPSSCMNNNALSREPASKLNLKRKFSAVSRPSVHRVSKEKTVAGPPQDSSKQQYSRVEEDPSEKKLNLSEERKKEETNVYKQENSVASKSSNGGSSARLETDLVDPLRVVESVGKETRFHHNLEFPKLDNIFDSRECFDLYQHDQLRSSKHAQDDKDSYCADFLNESMRIDGVTDDHNENRQDYFQDVDPIPIPGPPGSFLPASPGGDMVSEELQENSSLTRVQSTEDHLHHDMIDRDSMSDSPISTISADPSLARSDSRSSDKFSVRYNTRDFSGFKNDQPCCCSRKEGVFSLTVASDHQDQESTLLRKRVLDSLNFRSETFSQAPETVISAMSPSKPVLRLMGKNLTVVKTDEDEPSLSQFQNVQNEFNSSPFGYHHHQHPVAFSQNPYRSPYSRTQVDSRPVQNPLMHKDLLKPMKEIIVIDDSPEEEDNDLMQMRRNWASLSSSSPVRNHMHSGHQLQSSLAFINGSFQTCSPFMEVTNNGNLGKWNCAPGGSSSPSTSHLRSSKIYYPHSFS